MRASQRAALAWDEVPQRTQLDVLIYEMVQVGRFATAERWAHTHGTRALLATLADRKRIWDKNIVRRAAQDAYTETATYYVSHDHRARGVRDSLLLLLYCG